MSELIHPRMLGDLHDFYASACTIQSAVWTRDAFGQEQAAWADLAGHVAIPCAIAPSGGREVEQPDMTYVVTSHTVSLAGDYPLVQEKMRAIIGTLTLNIRAVEHDSHAKTTRLSCQIVE